MARENCSERERRNCYLIAWELSFSFFIDFQKVQQSECVLISLTGRKILLIVTEKNAPGKTSFAYTIKQGKD